MALKTPGNSGGTTTLFSHPAGSWNQAAGTGWIGGAMVSPLVVDARVYVPTDGSVSGFGLLPWGAAAGALLAISK